MWMKKLNPELFQIKELISLFFGKYNLIQQIFSSMPPFMLDLLKTFQMSTTFHVAMLQRYKGFWDSVSA
jgi:hypothetical protein